MEDFVNDEWASFTQIAWLDMRTTSGTWRVAQGFRRTCRPGSSRRSAARRCTGPAPRCASRSTSSRPAPTTATSGRQPARLADRPRRDGALVRQGRGPDGRDPHERHPRPARQQQFQGASRRAPRSSATSEVHTGRMAINSAAARRARRLPADRLLLPGLQVRREMVDALRRDPQGRGRPASSRSARTARCVQDRARRRRQGDGRRLCRQGRQAATAEGAHRRGRRQFDREPAAPAQLGLARSSRTGSPTPPARSAATTCGT